MNNFELIDNYLTNRLGEPERAAFEKELETNAALKAEVAVQKVAIEGVKKARAAELKAMLNKVPMGASVSMEWTVLKIAAGVIGTGLLIAGLAYYFNGKESLNPTSLSTSIKDSIKQSENKSEPIEEVTPAPKEEEMVAPAEEQKKGEKQTEKKADKKAEPKVGEPAKPKIELVDPTTEMTENSSSGKTVVKNSNRPTVTASHIAVEADASNKNYSSHYQFYQGKLHLYGNFDKGLYEILEVNGDSRMLFMYYKELYYLLDEKQSVITLLEPIKDKTLISKLKEYRGR
jgi:hypothetical protein